MKTATTSLLLVFASLLLFVSNSLALTCGDFYNQANPLRQSVIRTPEGKRIVMPAENPSLDLPADLPADMRAFMTFLNTRSDKDLARIKRELTKVFGQDKAGSFTEKDGNGGIRPFYVKTNIIPMPISREYHDKLVKSTKALFEAKNDLLQLFYSKKNVTVEDLRPLAVEGVSDAVLSDVISYIKNNQYFENGLVSEKMRSYRFISVVGIDHALTTVHTMKALGFEFNGGTPSGASNTRSIIEAYKKVLPQFTSLFDRLLEADKTFEIFKKNLDAHGRHWTGKSEGISVAISPGPFNGAHPDVVTIAEKSGMPLVKASDLYIDRKGDLRLNQSGVDPKNHPLVTSIYSRTEESVWYSAANPKRNLGYKIPLELTQKEKENLNKKGLRIEHGIAYEFIKNEEGQIIDVQRDAYGNPAKLVILDGRLGKDPTLTAEEPASSLDIIDMIQNKKVYLSNVGGRTLDIKPLFSIISKHFSPKHANGDIFSPPETLELNDPKYSEGEYAKFYADPKKYVVKVAAESSGNGVDVVTQKGESEIKKIIAKVKADQSRVAEARKRGDKDAVAQFTIQEFVSSAVITTTIEAPEGIKRVTIIPDLRLFVLMSPTGQVDAGTMAYLGRNGQYESAVSNTGKGGDYFIPIVYESTHQKNKTLTPTIAPVRKAQGRITVSDKAALDSFLMNLGQLKHFIRLFDSKDSRYKAYWGQFDYVNNSKVTQFTNQYRAVMHILGPEFRPLQSLFDRLNSKEINDDRFRSELAPLLEKMKTVPNQDWPYAEVGTLIKYWITDWEQYQYNGN
ncbi:MAG: hypothetical protein JNL11_10545 [Bdellovibrionaceae bacterium]|nr:hypothetical protein [Pseudobdellovibrionaceae bacterium]